MKQSEEIKHLSDALAGLAYAITEIIDQRLKAAPQPRLPMSAGPTVPREEYLGKREVAQLFHVSQRTIDGWMKKGWLPYFKLGKMVRFQLSNITEQMNRRHRIQR